MTKATKISVSFALGMIPMLLLAHEYGPDPRYTGAPGDDKNGCASGTVNGSGGCHTSQKGGGPFNPSTPGGNGVFAAFSSGTTYTPGVPVTITVNVVDPVNTHYGFQMTARLESNLATAQAGDFTVGSTPACPATNETASCQIILCDDGEVKLSKGCPASEPVQFIEHDYTKDTHVGVGPYTFTWTPPATNVGNVHFYIAGNAVNNDLMADGQDHVYGNSYVLTPAAPAQPPTITSVNSGTDFGGMANFAAGSWLEIKGTNLSPGTRIWGGSDFNGSNAPTSLDGISASIHGKAAFVYYISPTQINVQAPADTATGPVAITVTNPAATSPAFTGQLAAAVPGMLAPASFNVNGTQYMVALYADGATYVGKTGLIPGVAFRPAKPGDALTAYGIGFGDVTPSIPPGIVVSQANSIPNLSMTLGGVSVKPGYAGLAPSFVGLYQFNFTVPNVPNADQPVKFSVGGVSAQSSMFLTVHN